MNRLVTFFLCLLYFGSLAAQNIIASEMDNYTQISGTIRNVTARTVGITFYSDMISFAEEQYQVPLDSADHFSMGFQLNEPTEITFDYIGQQIRFFLEPGDDLQLRFDGTNFFKSLVINGKGALSNYYLQQAYRLFGHWDEEHLLYEMAEREPMDFRRYMDGLRRQRWSFLKQFPDRDKFPANFQYYVAADIDYWWGYSLLRYQLEHYIAQGIPEAQLPAKYYDFLDELVISNDRATSNRYYLFFLDQYLAFRENNNEIVTSDFVNIRVDVPSLFILAKPEQQPIITEVKKGDRLRYLNEKTTFKSKILIKEALHEDYWYKVKTGNGYEGWAIGVGLVFEEPPKVDSLIPPIESHNKRYQVALEHLHGKALYYTLANDLYFRAQNMSAEVLEKAVSDFTLLNPIKAYDQILTHSLASVQRIENPALKSGATNYQIITAPEILSARPVRDIVVNTVPFKESKEKESKDKMPVISLELPGDVAELLYGLMKKRYIQAGKQEQEDEIKKESVVAAVTIPKQQAASPNPVATFSSEYIDIPLPENARPSTPTSFKGKLENYTNKPFKLVLYTDPITFKEETHELKLKPDNSFNLDFDLTSPQLGYLVYGESQTAIYLEPGDQLQVEFDAIHFHKTLQFKGRGNAANIYLLAKKNRFSTEEEDLRKQMKDAAPATFLKYMQEQRTLRLQFLGNYEKASEFTPSFAKCAKAEVQYWYAYELMNYPWEHPLYHEQNAPMNVPANYYDFLQKTEISNAAALPLQQYTYFLDQYFDYLLDLPENRSYSKMQLAEQYLYDDVLSFYKARIYTIACKRGKAKSTGPEIRDFIASCDNEIYNDVLRLAYNEAKGLVRGAIAPSFTLKDVNGQEVSLDDFKGKIVYLDFWASWCSPCVMQMRNSREWKSTFKEKDVVFIYVSLDKSKIDWQNFVKTLDSSNSIHLMEDSGNVYQSAIAKQYRVKRLPTVFILNKQGKVYYNSAKDTAHQRLSEMIDNLLLLN